VPMANTGRRISLRSSRVTLTDPAPPAPNAGFGVAVASAGDVNGDGFADIVVGALDAANSFAGAAYFYSGNAGGLSTRPAALTAPRVPNGYFGSAVAIAR